MFPSIVVEIEKRLTHTCEAWDSIYNRDLLISAQGVAAFSCIVDQNYIWNFFPVPHAKYWMSKMVFLISKQKKIAIAGV